MLKKKHIKWNTIFYIFLLVNLLLLKFVSIRFHFRKLWSKQKGILPYRKNRKKWEVIMNEVNQF